jgi:hypothetical protein
VTGECKRIELNVEESKGCIMGAKVNAAELKGVKAEAVAGRDGFSVDEAGSLFGGSSVDASTSSS